jgi:hypothetical protein
MGTPVAETAAAAPTPAKKRLREKAPRRAIPSVPVFEFKYVSARGKEIYNFVFNLQK